MKKWITLLLASAVISSLLLGTTMQPTLLLSIINQSFLFGLFFLMIGCLTLVVRSGFFVVFLRGFKQLKGMFFRKPRMIENDMFQSNDPAFEQKKETIARFGTYLLLTIGASLILFSLILTCFYYV
ncbi:DUF3899 domain-containing protein [uncultured Brevibacillus sp.]|uniref:DUF3899 domain-containing protein n=1 Tax=uncultured Brevibacillus sp. TaxID=169970 RepID=UPI00259336E7|nr:DUF3899 domain-containing protein [uncultured Brevibacillus sp.]